MNATTLEADQERSFCQRYSNRIRAYGLCHLRDTAAAEDLVQHVLLIVLQALRDGPRKVRGVGIPERHGASSSDSKVVVTPRACPNAANGRVKTCEES